MKSRTRHARSLLAFSIAPLFALAVPLPAAAVTSGSWTNAVSISEPSASDYNVEPRVLTTPNGNMAAIWESHEAGTDYIVKVSTSSDGGVSWQPPQSLTPSNEHTEQANLVVTESGSLLAYWLLYGTVDGDQRIFVKISRSIDGGANWSSAQTISDPDVSTSWPVAVAHGLDGMTIGMQTPSGLFTRSSTDGGATWTSFNQITDATPYAGFPALTSDATGGLLFAWRSGVLDNATVMTSVSHDSGSTWSSEEPVSGATGAYFPIRALSTGPDSFTLLWPNSNTGELQLASSSDGGNVWTGASTLGITESNEYNMTSLALPTGEFGIAWVSSVDSIQRIYVRTSNDGGNNWNTPTEIDSAQTSESDGFLQYPRLALSMTGAWIATWTFDGGEMSGSDNRIQASSSTDNALNWGGTSTVAKSCGDRASVTPARNGSLVTVWACEFDGVASTIDAAAYAPGAARDATAPALAATGLNVEWQMGLAAALLTLGVAAGFFHVRHRTRRLSVAAVR